MSKIAFVIGTMQCGGAQRVVSVLSKFFFDKGYDTDIITTSDDRLDYELQNGVRFISLTASCKLTGIKQVQCFYKMYNWLKCEKYDYVIAFLPMTCIYVSCCKILGLKFRYIASERMDPRQDPSSRMLRQLRDWAYSKTDKMVFQTEDAREYFSESIKKKSQIIYNPLNEKIPEPDYSDREKKIVTAVRLEAQKNIPMLIDAFEMFCNRYPDYTLEVYGQGSLYQELNKMIEEKGLTERFMLKGFSDDVYFHMRNAKMFVLSSDYEGVSNSMLEALCMGLPVVTTDHPIGGAKMFVKNGFNGFLSDVGDASGLSQNMEKVVCMSTEEYSEMAHNAYSVKSELLPMTICQKWEQFIVG